MKVATGSLSGFSEELATLGACGAAVDDDLTSGLVDTLTIDIRTYVRILTHSTRVLTISNTTSAVVQKS